MGICKLWSMQDHAQKVFCQFANLIKTLQDLCLYTFPNLQTVLRSSIALDNYYNSNGKFGGIFFVSIVGQSIINAIFFFPGLFFIIFSYFGSFMVVWGLGFYSRDVI